MKTLKAVNLIQHPLTDEQKKELGEKFNVTEFVPVPEEILANFKNSSDDSSGLEMSAVNFLNFLETQPNEVLYVLMPGGSPALNACLWKWAGYQHNKPKSIRIALFAHSVRESSEKTGADGKIEKISIFKHRKFIEVSMS